MNELNSPVWQRQESSFKNTVTAFLEVMTKKGRNVPYSPKKLFDEICSWKQCSNYKLGGQQDAAELLTILIEKLSDENKPAGNLFTGELQTTTCFHMCNNKTASDEFFRILAINMKKDAKKKTATSIEDLLQSFMKEEQLNKMNKYDCINCGKLLNATRQPSVAVAPRILAIQLKRFSRISKRRRT